MNDGEKHKRFTNLDNENEDNPLLQYKFVFLLVHKLGYLPIFYSHV